MKINILLWSKEQLQIDTANDTITISATPYLLGAIDIEARNILRVQVATESGVRKAQEARNER